MGVVEIGLGVDSRLGLSPSQLRDLAADARAFGYQSMWTNAGADYDPVALCVAWHERSGLPTGISVVPIARNPPAVLALAALTASDMAHGEFTLGIGSGSVTDRPIRAVRDYLGEVAKIAPRVRTVVGALGPQMLRLASRHSTGAALNWCTPEQIAWSRQQVGPMATLIEYLRVCVDDDVAAARAALAAQILGYAHARPGSGGYRAHFERMGFHDELAFLDSRKAAGAGPVELARAIPERMLTAFGYAGRGDGAREWFARSAEGLDVAIVRVLTPRPGDVVPVRRVMEAFAPRAAGVSA